jgi:hypothetical protein
MLNSKGDARFAGGRGRRVVGIVTTVELLGPKTVIALTPIAFTTRTRMTMNNTKEMKRNTDIKEKAMTKKAIQEVLETAWWDWHDEDCSRWSSMEEAEERCAAWVRGDSDDGPRSLQALRQDLWRKVDC